MGAGTKSTMAGLSGKAGIVVLGLVTVALSAGWAANCLGEVIWNLAGYAIRMVPSLIFVAAQGIQAHGFGQCGVSDYFPQLVSCLSTVLVIGGTL